MTYIITSQCIECYRCESICPTGAITRDEHQTQISSECCNDCVGHYSVPQCWAACPTQGGCVPDLAILPRSITSQRADDYWDNWFITYNALISRLQANSQSEYWQRWFDRYSQALSRQLHPSPLVGVHS